MKANVELHIDELVLHGLPNTQRDLIAAAVEAGLQRMLEEGGLSTSLEMGAALPEVRVDGLRVEPGAKPGDVGERIAGSIYESMVGSRESSNEPGGRKP